MAQLNPLSELKRVWLLRHGDNELHPNWRRYGCWQRYSPLTPAGHATIERVRWTHLDGVNFSILRHSPFIRASETAHRAMPNCNWQAMNELAPRLPEVLDTMMRTAEGEKPFQTPEEIEARWPGFLKMEGEWMVQAIERVLGLLEPGQEALLVSHQPLIGMARGILDPDFRRFDQSLPKGGIYRLVFGNDGDFVEADTLLPPD